MVTLEQIDSSLNSNESLNDDLRSKFNQLVRIFNKKFPDIELDKLSDRLKTVKFGRISKFEKKGIYFYDVLENKIMISSSIKEDYDVDHILMKCVLQMIASAKTYTGFSSDDRLRALNLAYTEILANYLVGNEGISELEEEILVTNLISHVIGKDVLFNSYFTNDGEPIIKAMRDVEVGL